MLIECKYYDVAAKEMEELDKQIAEESENLSEYKAIFVPALYAAPDSTLERRKK